MAQRAIFGERQNAHDLLAASGERDLFRRFSAIEVDLPADDPTSSKWEPFFRGWRAGDNYFFARTIPDFSAKRPGMVRTQILAFAAAEVGEIADLGPLLADLEASWDTPQVGPFTMLLEHPSKTADALLVPRPEVVAAVEIVAGGPASTTPGAIVGQADFKAVVAELWRRLPPELRADFAFGFSFSPADLQHRKLHLICAPAILADRWRNYPCRIAADASLKPSAGAAFLLGLPEAESVRDFITTAKLSPPDLVSLASYVRVAKYWAERTTLDLGGWIALAKDLTVLAPQSEQGEVIKRATADQLAKLMSAATAADILSLRNLRTEAFATGGQIATSLQDSIRRHLELPADTNLAEILNAWLRPASPFWSESVRAGLTAALASPSAVVAANLWFLWPREKLLFKPIADLIPTTPEAERCLVVAVPAQIAASLSALLVPWCRTRDWWLAHARVLLASKPWRVAITEHLAADRQIDRREPVQLLLGAVDPAVALDFCVAETDARARQGGVELCLQHPALWARFDGSSAGWRDLLEQAWADDSDLLNQTRGVEIRNALLAASLDGVELSENLLRRLGLTPFADLSDYPRRDEALARLPLRVRPSFVAATAIGWIQRFFRDQPETLSLDGELRIAVFGPAISGRRFSAQIPNLIRGGVALLTTCREATETVFVEWIEAVAISTERFSLAQTGQVVALLKRKGWERGALTLKHLAERNHRTDFYSIWDGYWASLGWQDKFLLKFSDVFGGGPAPITSARPRAPQSTEKTAVFVTALNLEFDAVCVHLADVTKKSIGGAIYAVGLFMHGQSRCKVVVALAGMGNAEATLATDRAIQNFSPHYAFFVGIAGGLKNELQLGDVVVADKVYAYEAGKAKEEFQSRPKAPVISYAAIQMANAVARGEQWRHRIKPSTKEQPKAYVKPIAAGEKVIDSHQSDVFKLIAERFGDAYAVAMEDFGFVVAAHATPNVTFAAVRSISDFAREKTEAEKKNSQATAAANAAAFAFEMLAGYLEASAQDGSEKMESHLL